MYRTYWAPAMIIAALVLIFSFAWSGEREPPTHAKPPGAAESTKTEILSAGAKVLQTHSPLSGFNVYLMGFHPMKDNPSLQLEAHHYCKVVNQDFMQCILFDGNTPQANLNGIEYIISEKLFNNLPSEEKRY
jgi:Protein of unknown function (DUF1264)